MTSLIIKKMAANKQIGLDENLTIWYVYVIEYFPFVIIALGLTGNLFTLVVLRTNKELQKQSSMIIFSFISILDLLSLFTWNLDSYFTLKYNFIYETKILAVCRIMVFLQYFGLQSSALLMSFISIDRFFTIISRPGSFVARLPFGKPRTAFIWSTSIVGFIFLLNSHFLFLGGAANDPATILNKINTSLANISRSKNFSHPKELSCYFYTPTFRITSVWNKINIIIYSLIPSVVLIAFNSLIIIKTINFGKNLNRFNINSVNAFKRKRRMTVSLVSIAFLFLSMSLPNTIFYAFFYDKDDLFLKYLGVFTNDLLFLYHSTLFFNLSFTNVYFRRAFINLVWQVGSFF